MIKVNEVLPETIDGKSTNRIKGYKRNSTDWQAQLNMLLPDGVTCKSCVHCQRCCMLFGQNESDTFCQFYPSRANLVNLNQAEKLEL